MAIHFIRYLLNSIITSLLNSLPIISYNNVIKYRYTSCQMPKALSYLFLLLMFCDSIFLSKPQGIHEHDTHETTKVQNTIIHTYLNILFLLYFHSLIISFYNYLIPNL